MNELVHRIKQNTQGKQSIRLVLFPALLAALTALGLFAYLGTFSRLGSDDYCLSAFYYQDSDFVTNMVHRYQHASSRYTNILFIGFADKVLGWYNPAILPPLMLALFVLGLYLFLDQIQGAARLGWSRGLCFYLAALAVYFSLVQTPNLYETYYWRAGMTSHFAPIALLPLLGAFVMQQIRLASERPPSIWAYVVCFIVPFLIGGLSEPPTTVMITVLALAIGAVWWWVKTPARRPILLILFWTLAGALASLTVLALAPANSARLGRTATSIFTIGWNTFYRTFEALVVSVRTLPLPVLLSILLPGLLFGIHHASRPQDSSKLQQKQLALLIPIVLVIGFVLIAASFAPSVYGQGFPAARARFAGVLLWTCTCMMIGAIMGILMANRGVRSSRFTIAIMVAFTIISLYPFRTAWRLAPDVPVYQQRAAAWDKRDARIRSLKAQGAQDLVVPFLKGEILQDLDDRTQFRLNRCASAIYGVNSIIAIPMKQE